MKIRWTGFASLGFLIAFNNTNSEASQQFSRQRNIYGVCATVSSIDHQLEIKNDFEMQKNHNQIAEGIKFFFN